MADKGNPGEPEDVLEIADEPECADLPELEEIMKELTLHIPSAKQVREYLAARKLCQVDAAKDIGIDDSTLSKWIAQSIAHYRKRSTEPTRTTVKIATWWRMHHMPVVKHAEFGESDGYLTIYRQCGGGGRFTLGFDHYRDMTTMFKASTEYLEAKYGMQLVFCVYSEDAKAFAEYLHHHLSPPVSVSFLSGPTVYTTDEATIARLITACAKERTGKKDVLTNYACAVM